MKTYVRFLSLLLAAVFSASATVSVSAATSAEASVLIEAESGDIICEQNAHERLPMASTTKIMTALVALENESPETVVKIPPSAVGIEGSSVYLTADEELTLEELVYALMLESANDAAAAIAYEISGSIERFAELMNERAHEIGAVNTHFTNPHGLDDEDHYTTAYDLAIITREALKNPDFRKITSTVRHTIPSPGGGSRLLVNHNRLLRSYDGCIGVKTGFTKRSGRCLVTAAEHDGVTVIAVTLSDPDDWRDHEALLTSGLEKYEHISLTGDGVAIAVPITGGDVQTVYAVNADDIEMTLPKGSIITSKTVLEHFCFAPITSGEVLGRLEWYSGGELIASTELVASSSIPRKVKPSWKDRFLRGVSDTETNGKDVFLYEKLFG